MKTRNKALLTILCAFALVVCSVFGTYAYLTATTSVTNTFTVGKVEMTLDETDVDEYGVKATDTRTSETQSFILVPGHEYIKDPKVTIKANSEKCFVFVKVENPFTDIEDTSSLISEQITNNGWTALTDVSNVYYKEHSKVATAEEYPVFSTFKLSTTANSNTEKWAAGDIVVTAYAIQVDGFEDSDSDGTAADEAWAAGGFN